MRTLPRAFLAGQAGDASNTLSFFRAYLISCLYFPLVILTFVKSSGYRRRSFSYVLDHYWLVYGLYVTTRMWLRKLHPRAITVANDVDVRSRVIAKAARDERIRTVYVQHASVPERFPPLAFDYALLEGQDALTTSAHAGPSPTRVYLVGMPKHDAHSSQVNRRSSVRALGICTNGLDPIDGVEQLCGRIRQEFATLPIILRPHNADLRTQVWKRLSLTYNLEYSDMNTELSYDFLKRVDALIAGDSNIHLEAAMMDVVPWYYDFAQTRLDWYRFQRNDLVQYVSDSETMCSIIRQARDNKPSVRLRAKQYCVTVGSPYDGRSSELASTVLQALASPGKNGHCLPGWKRVPNVALEAYEPAEN